jgi:drug/metabolite transporter (DMT)-like permease
MRKSEESRPLLSRRTVETTKNDSKMENEEDDKNATGLAIAFGLMLLFSLANRIFGRLQTYPMHNYPLFNNILSVFIYVPICFSYIIPQLWCGKSITKDQQEIPKYKFAVMGGYDSLAGIMQTFAINYISNASMIVLVQQSAIPISMLISKYALNSTYTHMQYVGSSIVLLGIVVVLIPNFLQSPSTSSMSESDPMVQLMWLGVLVVSCVPMCLSSVYKEKALGEVDIDITYLNGWVAVFQFLIALPLCVPLSEVQHIPMNEIVPHMNNGFKCWMGVNSITAENNPSNSPLDDCSSAPLYVNLYLFFNVVYNFLIVIILKLGSANILYMSSTVIVPLSNVVFSLKFIPGNQPLRTWDIIGLLVIMLGLVIYRFNKDLLSLLQSVRGIKSVLDDEELESKHFSKKLLKDAERKQLRYLGLNQMESLQSLLDLRLMKEKHLLLFRSPQQIRGHFYNKINVPPSPLLSANNRVGYNSLSVSPSLPRGVNVKAATGLKPATASYLTKNYPFQTQGNSVTVSYGVSGGKNKQTV